MSENLTPEQIEALFGSSDVPPEADTAVINGSGELLSDEEADILGEVGNMCMGASATTMYTILGRKVNITTPKVWVYPNLVSMLSEYNVPYIVVEVNYTEGVTGRNLLLLKTTDAAMITDIMMGGDGNVDLDHVELNELHLSAISEIMNQMVAAGATSMSQILNMIVNISPPSATLVDLAINDTGLWESENDRIIKISFSMEIEGLLNSELMQVMPYSFGKHLVDVLLKGQDESASAPPVSPAPTESHAPSTTSAFVEPSPSYAAPPSAYAAPPPAYSAPPATAHAQPVNVQPVQYQSFDPQPYAPAGVHDNLDMIIDVPLQVTVELGKARKSIKEVLDFNIGSVIVLDKLAGELVEVVVNGKLIARGEVVVIDENYGVRITEIVAPNRRL